MIIETTDNPEYPNPIPVEFVKDKCELLDNIRVGQEIGVEFFLSGNQGKDQYADRVFLSLRGFNFSFVDSGVTTSAPQTGGQVVTDELTNAANEAGSSEEVSQSDNLPF